jgi:hypothetical protein
VCFDEEINVGMRARSGLYIHIFRIGGVFEEVLVGITRPLIRNPGKVLENPSKILR